MYTQCPECKTQHSVSTQELRSSRGMLRCNTCAMRFDALEFISEQPLITPQEREQPLLLRNTDKTTATHAPGFWLAGISLGLLILFAQFIYFESYNLSQNNHFRPWIIKLCSTLACQLPDYKNTDEISILQGSLENRQNNGYRFKAVIVNQADFNQPYPDLQLTLLNFIGEPFAERVFKPQHYGSSSPQLAVDESAEIVLDIAPPDHKIGGYRFKFL